MLLDIRLSVGLRSNELLFFVPPIIGKSISTDLHLIYNINKLRLLMESHNYKKLQVVDDSLKGKLEGKDEIEGYANLSFERLAFQFALVVVDMRGEITLDQAIDYYTAVVHSNINRADNIKKNQRE